MYSSQLLAAALAATLVSAQNRCDDDVTIESNNEDLNCRNGVFSGDITVSGDLTGELVLTGFEQLNGSLIINGTDLRSFSCDSVNAISDELRVEGAEFLNTLTLSSLTSVGSITLQNLNNLPGVTFGSEGLEEVDTIRVSDTYIDDLSGLNVAQVQSFFISSNRRMRSFDSRLVNITGADGLTITDNGPEMELQLSELEVATELQFRGGIKSVSIPLLQELNKSLKIDENDQLTTFFAPNLTKVGEAVSFRDNEKLANVTMPKLEQIGGDLAIIGNPEMEAVDGFPELETIRGALELGGNFEKVELPKLARIEGTANVTSTTDIAEFCEYFEDLEDDDSIDGDLRCTSNNDDALDGEADKGDSGSNRDSNDDDDDAAGNVGVNMAVLGLAVVFGIVQLL